MDSILYRCPSTNCKEMASPNTLQVGGSKGLFDFDYEIVCKNGFYLADNISNDLYETWFNSKCINVLNKTQCGNGGTTGFINYALNHCKGLLIIVPNVSICKSKEEEYKNNDDVCCVYGGCAKITKDAKVVIATYDQFHKLMNGGIDDYGVVFKEDLSSTIWSGRTILVDEYHKIVDECSFRGVCYDVTKLIKQNKNGVMLMSATPHWGYTDFLREYIPEREVRTYTVKYEDEEGMLIDRCTPRSIQIYDVKEKIADIISRMYRSPKNKQIVVFYNNRKNISQYIQKMNIQDVEVLCSQEHSDEFAEFYSEIFNPNKRIHFMTSAYFTGCDINVHINACVIIGSKSHSFLSYGGRDIKQMIGRFRQGCTVVHLLYNGKVQDAYDYNDNKTNYDLCLKKLQGVADDWKNNDESVREKQKSLMLKDKIENSENWMSIKCLKQMLSDYGYIVKDCKVPEFKALCPINKISTKEVKKKIIEGNEVGWMENSMAGQYKAYLDKFGAEALMKASQMDVKNWYKIRKNIGDEEDRLSIMLPNELCDAVGLDDGYYSGSFLMACLKYVGVKCQYDELSLKLMEIFDVYACAMYSDSNHKREKWLIVRKYNLPKDDVDSLYNMYLSKVGKMYYSSLISYNHKRDTQNHCLGKTNFLSNLTFPSLKEITLYKWVMEDKEHRLALVKADASKMKTWNNIKNYQQTKISEMFQLTDKQYLHSIKEMHNINCLICDIDSGISFSEFKDRYKMYQWTAYPTLNNIDKDWKKFRVVVPLDNMIELKGEHNLKVLKLLRKMFCAYEDPNHQMPSYINQEDWEQRYENKGEKWHIAQDYVDNLTLRIENFRDYMNRIFTKNEKFHSENKCRQNITFDEAKEHFDNSFRLGDGARHKTLFVIKNRLSADDMDLFQNWLASNHPTYLKNWRSHRVI